jgi:hypothetical protein
MATTEIRPQCLVALERANTLRTGGAAVKREIKHGVLSLRAALDDPRAGVLPVYDLLAAQRRWGRERTVRALAVLRVRDTKRVRDLTSRQREAIVSVCEARHD